MQIDDAAVEKLIADLRAANNVPPPPPLPPTREDGRFEGMPENDLERRVGDIEGRLWWLAGGIAGAFVALLGIMLAQFSQVGDRFARVETRLEAVTVAQAEIRGDIKTVDVKLDAIQKALDERLPAKR